MKSRFASVVVAAVVMGVGGRVRSLHAADGSGKTDENSGRRATYVDAVTRGAGFLPWQERGISEAEAAFRESMERRKDRLLAGRVPVEHPTLLGKAEIEQARRNVEVTEWAKSWFGSHKKTADYIVEQPDGFVEQMIPELTPTNPYGFTCPNCVGKKSQEATGSSLVRWDHRKPDTLACRRCKHAFPSEAYPETATLICPRTDQTFRYYLNDAERAHPDDRSGKYAWHWVGYPIHVSFTGIIRMRQIQFMKSGAKSLGVAYALTDDVRYAERAAQILVRLAHCYRKWLYHDYWDTVADCDPLYAAWHDKKLPLEWKRHLCAQAFKRDKVDRAAMLQNFWGAGRIHPSTDTISGLADLALAYDLIHDARTEDGRSVWQTGWRKRVERDLFLEYLFGAEPFLGGEGKADNHNNKSPRVYHALAAVGKCLGLPAFVDTALRGYEAVRDKSFLYDGFSRESPAYTNMYLGNLIQIPEKLHGFRWPEGFKGRSGVVDLYANDARLGLMFRSVIDQLRPDGRYIPSSDTRENTWPSPHIVEVGLKRYPEHYRGALPTLRRGRGPSEYGVLHLPADEIERDSGLHLPEILYPAWKTAILRHGHGRDAALLALTFSPPGGHRQRDNLALYYVDRNRTVLGDLGYVGDMPLNSWIRSTLSHNLVVVDDKDQRHGGKNPRRTQFHAMFTSPRVSMVEASADVYAQCGTYRRRVALMKGPDGRTFAVDIFRVRGGSKHAFRLFSELASSDAKDGALEFSALDMPPEPPLPKVGASLKREDIYGLRDTRIATNPPPAWQVVWKQKGDAYRLWMLSPADAVAASNGPGQESLQQPGRRVRYLDVIREGEDVTSTFVAVHEPAGPDGKLPVRDARRLSVDASAGPDAVAVEIDSMWGRYLVLCDFADEVEVNGVRFQGAFGVVGHGPDGKRWFITSGASTLKSGDLGFAGLSASWSGGVKAQTESEFLADTSRPADWPAAPESVTGYVRVETDGDATGFAVRAVSGERISVDRFPLPEVKRFDLPLVRTGTAP